MGLIFVNFRKKLKHQPHCKEGKSKHILLGILSMSSATADRITVFVKPLFGDTLSLEIHPSYDLKDVADELSRSDPVAFPFGLTIIRFMDEEQKEITDETMLMVLVQDPIESIVRVDTFDWEGNTAYRLRIQADRTKSMDWMNERPRGPRANSDLNFRRQFPQLFDVCYYPADKTFMVPDGGDCLDDLQETVGKRAKRVATVLKGRLVYRRDNVGLHEFDDDISRLPTEGDQVDWSAFVLNEDGRLRISYLINTWISEQSF